MKRKTIDTFDETLRRALRAALTLILYLQILLLIINYVIIIKNPFHLNYHFIKLFCVIVNYLIKIYGIIFS